MPGEETGTNRSQTGGFFEPFKAVAWTLVGVLQTRLELAFIEIEEEQERLKAIVLLIFVSLFCLGLGVLLLTLFIVVLFWETHRLYALGACAVLYLSLGLYTGWLVRKRTLRKPGLLSATLSELAKDRERLRSE